MIPIPRQLGETFPHRAGTDDRIEGSQIPAERPDFPFDIRQPVAQRLEGVDIHPKLARHTTERTGKVTSSTSEMTS